MLSSASSFVQMNADHKDALILLAKQFGGIEAQQGGDDFGRWSRFPRANRDRVREGSDRPVANQRSVRRDGEAARQG